LRSSLQTRISTQDRQGKTFLRQTRLLRQSQAAQYKSTALWVFHGEKDESVPIANSRQIVAAIKKAGGQVKYPEYPGEGHSIWTIVAKEPELLQWLFSQHR